MKKIWLKQYPDGVPAEVDTGEYKSINAMVGHSFAEYAGRPAFAGMGVTLTYRETDRLSRDFAAYLQNLGLKKGARVALMMPNILQYPAALFGVLRAGMIVVNVNPLYTARELEHQLKDSGAEAIVVVSLFAPTVRAVIEKTSVRHVVVTGVGDLLGVPKRWIVNFVAGRRAPKVSDWPNGATAFRDALSKGAGLALVDADPKQDDTAFLQYTGGTTGLSKGAILTHGNIIANVLQGQAWLAAIDEPGDDDIVITALPLYHIYALTVNCFSYVRRGGLNVLIANPRDMAGFVKELKNWKFTAMTGVNTLYNGLLNTPGFEEIDFSRLTLAMGGGAAIQRPVAERWKKATGTEIVEGYGLSETSPIATSNLPDGPYTGGIGYPIPSTEVKICDGKGKELPLGKEGEICVRGPQVMKGYWNRPKETKAAFTTDKFFRTGDIGFMEKDGLVRLTDRKKDMINVSGFNVYPSEIEEVLASHEGILEAAAIGVPDDNTGEAVKAFVVLKDKSLTADQIKAHCKKNLTNYKVPKQIEFRDDLPKTPIGKILRRELRDAREQAKKEREAA